MEENGAERLVCLAVSLTAVGQKQGEAGAKDEERRGMTGGEGVAVMHVDTRNQRQCTIGEALEGTDGTLQTEGVFQQLQESTARQLAESHEQGEADLFPQQREQRKRVDGPFGYHGVILEEGVLNACVPRVQQEMELEFRIQTKQSAHDEK